MLPGGPYNPNDTENEILKYWLENNFYKPEFDRNLNKLRSESEINQDNRESFTIILPPPNANGSLHLGHMSGYAYQDLMARYQRMHGKRVLLLPGKDHAGIQTEVVFEKELEKLGTSKKDLGREEFYKQCYEFCMRMAETARSQEKNIGLSADFDRELFTLDPRVVDEVLTAFTQMHTEGLIYRGKRLINWCVRCQSALADIDTEFEEATTPFFYFKYAISEPQSEALRLRDSYNGKTVSFKFERNQTRDGKQRLPFAFGTIDSDKMLDHDLEVIGIGYSDEQLGQEVSGIATGVLMRLDNNFRLIVVNPEFKESLRKELTAIFLFEAAHYAGAHIIVFENAPEDIHYTNGFVIGTVRPETIFGDTAIAAYPDDARFQQYIGQKFTVKTPIGTQELSFIGDKAVDPAFGTGLLKVTPAHAFEDWDIAERHPDETMPEKQVIDFFGKLNHLTGKYNGLSIDEAREQMAQDMKAAGMIVYIDYKYKNKVKVCERCKTRIEPLVSHQWFVNTRPLKAKAKQLVEEKLTQVLPDGKQKVYLDWMNTPEDWCITRQLWWGYRLPVWYKGGKQQVIDETGVVKEMINGQMITDPAQYQDLMHVGLTKPEGDDWIQDDDVLDTWFSSGQWPYVTLKVHELLNGYYPTQVMETGWDILIFWVTRMMMLNPFRREQDGINDMAQQLPFNTVYLHGLVLDKEGKKMSKSKGNGIDPFEMMNKYGTDALRLSFVIGNAPGQNYRLYEEKIAGYAKFANKIWNAARFVMMNLGEDYQADLSIPENPQQETNKDLMNHLAEVQKEITHLMDTFQFGIAAQSLYTHFWHEFCDIHIEKAKPHIMGQKDKNTGEFTYQPTPEETAETKKCLHYTLFSYLKMLHPFMPFMTERIWMELAKPADNNLPLMYQNW